MKIHVLNWIVFCSDKKRIKQINQDLERAGYQPFDSAAPGDEIELPIYVEVVHGEPMKLTINPN